MNISWKTRCSYDSINLEKELHKLCTNFWAFSDRRKILCYIKVGEGKLRKEKSELLKSECKDLMKELAKVEQQIKDLGREEVAEKEMRHLARLIYVGKMIEKVGLLYSFNEQSLCKILTENKNKISNPSDYNVERKKLI